VTERKDAMSPAFIPQSFDNAFDMNKLDLAVRAVDAMCKRMDAMVVRNGARGDVDELTTVRAAGPAERGIKIPMPKDPKERAEYEAGIARRKAAGGGRFVGDAVSAKVDANSPLYDAGLVSFREAGSKFREAQRAYRAREIDDAEFLKAKAEFDYAQREMDKVTPNGH